MYGTGFGIHDCDPVTRARSFRGDFEREIAQMQLRAEARKAGPVQPKAARTLLWARLGRAMRVAHMRHGLAAQ